MKQYTQGENSDFMKQYTLGENSNSATLWNKVQQENITKISNELGEKCNNISQIVYKQLVADSNDHQHIMTSTNQLLQDANYDATYTYNDITYAVGIRFKTVGQQEFGVKPISCEKSTTQVESTCFKVSTG